MLPTLFELSGLEEPYSCQGRSFAPLLTGSGDYEPRDAVFSENVIPEVITTGSLDFAFEKGRGIKGVRHPDAKMIRTRRWKLVRYGGGEGELYDLENDPGEDRNLYDDPAHAKVRAQLHERLLDWLLRADRDRPDRPALDAGVKAPALSPKEPQGSSRTRRRVVVIEPWPSPIR